MAKATDDVGDGDTLADRVSRLADFVAANLPKLPSLDPRRADAARRSLDDKLERWLGFEDERFRRNVVTLIYGEYGTSLPNEVFTSAPNLREAVRQELTRAVAADQERADGDGPDDLQSGRRDP